MLKEKELNTQPAGIYAFYAARDAWMKAVARWSTYTESERVRAERMKLGLELCYSAKAFYINPRAKFIAIKVENPTVKDRKNLSLLEQDYKSQGITKTVSAQGIIYKIPKV